MLSPLNSFSMRHFFALFLLFAATVAAQTDAPAKSAHELAGEVKDQLVETIDSKAAIEKEGGPDAYYRAISAVFEPVVDYPLIARYVMGNFYAQASEDQRGSFAKKLEAGLMRSVVAYSQGLALSGDYQFAVLPPKGDLSGEDRVAVGMEARSGDSVNQLTFHLLRVDKHWRLVNLVLGKANMGDLLRAQFAAAVAKHKGDLEQAINSWGA